MSSTMYGGGDYGYEYGNQSYQDEGYGAQEGYSNEGYEVYGASYSGGSYTADAAYGEYYHNDPSLSILTTANGQEEDLMGASTSSLPVSIRQGFDDLRKQFEAQFGGAGGPAVQGFKEKINLLEEEVAKCFSQLQLRSDREEMFDDEEEGASDALPPGLEEPTAATSASTNAPVTSSSSSTATSFRKEIQKHLDFRGIRLWHAKDKSTPASSRPVSTVPATPTKKTVDFSTQENLEKLIKAQRVARRALYIQRWRKLGRCFLS